MKKFYTKEEVIKELDKRKIKWRDCSFYDSKIQLELPQELELSKLRVGMKMVRIFENREFPKFGEVYTITHVDRNGMCVNNIRHTSSCSRDRFIPLSWLKNESKCFLPTWF